MRAIIVDDEPRAIELLEKYLSHFSQIELIGTFRNGLKAFEFMSAHKADLIFLDINMPHLSGLSLSRMIDNDTRVIFTTAYSEFAVESYDVNAVDYLLKPITFERFGRAMGRVLEKDESDVSSSRPLLIKSGSRLHRIAPEEIVYLEKDGNYITYFLVQDKVLARATVDEALASLPDHFMQVHKSYIVNVNFVRSIEKNSLMAGDKEIPIGASFGNEVRQRLLK